mmetsp:Transcript_2355/g.2313  ORF Transcript_2355/g.2313 Transcript_2355/m.2313 type:complete len:121 (-) Transcript_2355:301-663(-)
MVQEVKGVFMAFAQKAGFLYISSLEDPQLNSTYLSDGGIMVLSRFPILRHEFMPFSFGIGNDGFTKRGIIYSEIAIGGQLHKADNKGGSLTNYARLHLFNTHMQSSHFEHSTDQAVNMLK